MTDSQLRREMKKSPQKAQTDFFNEYCGYVYAIVANKLKNCGNSYDIEECVADSFKAFFELIEEKSEFEGDLKGILGTIARNKAISVFRKLTYRQSREKSIEDDDFNEMRSEENVAQNAEKSIMRETILRCVKRLGKPDSDIIIQSYFYGRTSAQIADSLNLTDGGVQKRIQRARKKLKKLLIAEGIDAEG